MRAFFEQLLSMTMIGSLIYGFGSLSGIGGFGRKHLRLRHAFEGLALFFYLFPAGLLINLLLRFLGKESFPAALISHFSVQAATLSKGTEVAYSLLQIGTLSKTVLYGLLLIWLIGAVLYLIRQWRHGHALALFLRRHTMDCQSWLLRSLYDEECMRLGVRRQPALLESGMVHSPFITMLRGRFYILVPSDGVFTEEEWRLMLRHELTHYCHRDLLVRRLLMLGDVLHWFNPVWRRYSREMALRAEIACDGSLMENMTSAQRRSYGEVLLKTAESGEMGSSVGLSHSGKLLRERLRCIASPELLHNRHPWLMRGFLTLAAGIGVAAACLMQDMPTQAAGLLLKDSGMGVSAVQSSDKDPTSLPHSSNLETTDGNASSSQAERSSETDTTTPDAENTVSITIPQELRQKDADPHYQYTYPATSNTE